MTDHEDLPPRIAPEERPLLSEDHTPEPDPEPAEPARSRPLAWLREMGIVVATALVLSFLIKTFLVQAFFIPSPSMEPTLMVDDKILVNRLATGEGELNRGDIVVFVDPGGWLTDAVDQPTGAQKVIVEILTFIGILPQHAGEHLVKRVIGLPGDHVVCCTVDGRISVNGVAIDETYLPEGMAPSDVPFDVTVPADSLWVMGDNRSNSRDSRAHTGEPGGGFVPIDNVVGRAFVIILPFDRMGWLGGADAAFAAVPDP